MDIDKYLQRVSAHKVGAAPGSYTDRAEDLYAVHLLLSQRHSNANALKEAKASLDEAYKGKIPGQADRFKTAIEGILPAFKEEGAFRNINIDNYLQQLKPYKSPTAAAGSRVDQVENLYAVFSLLNENGQQSIRSHTLARRGLQSYCPRPDQLTQFDTGVKNTLTSFKVKGV